MPKLVDGGRSPTGWLADRRRRLAAAVAAVVKDAVARIGDEPNRYAGHSLRSGLATSAAAAGVEERVIAVQTGHRSVSQLRGYVRHGSLFTQNAAASLGL